MKTLVQSTQYKKDLKRIRHNAKKAEALLAVLRLLENEIPIPPEYKPHMLTGDYNGYMECHIEGDFLLIRLDPDTTEIDLVRLGSHSELFGKGNNAELFKHYRLDWPKSQGSKSGWLRAWCQES